MKIYRTKKEKKSIPIVMKTCFSEEKLIKQFGNPLPREPPISEQLFYDPPLYPNFKIKNPPNFMGGGGGIYVLAVRWSVK